MNDNSEHTERSRKRLHKGFVLAAAAALVALYLDVMHPQLGFGSFQHLLLFVFPILPGDWFLVAVVVVLVLLGIAAIVYSLSSFIDSPNARGWAKAQIYEGIFTIALILFFLASLSLFFINPAPALASINLVSTNQLYGCYNTFDMYQLAACNLASFQDLAFNMFATLYYATLYAGYAPGISLSFVSPSEDNLQFTAGSSLSSILPVSAETSFSFGYSVLLLLILLNQVQTILISGSLFWFAFFIGLGLIARAFGFTRTFGGAMIALGFGLGFVYPLLVNVTYGFLNYQLTNPLLTGQALATDIYAEIFYLAVGVGGSVSGQWMFQLGVLIAGLTFIPFLNFTVLDAFIVDFSKAMGERLDFMSILTGVI